MSGSGVFISFIFNYRMVTLELIDKYDTFFSPSETEEESWMRIWKTIKDLEWKGCMIIWWEAEFSTTWPRDVYRWSTDEESELCVQFIEKFWVERFNQLKSEKKKNVSINNYSFEYIHSTFFATIRIMIFEKNTMKKIEKLMWNKK